MSKRKDRERAESGIVFREGKLLSDDLKPTIVRKPIAVSDNSRNWLQRIGRSAIQAMGYQNQVQLLSDSLDEGRITGRDLRKKIADNAPAEMRKGAEKLKAKRQPITVDNLLKEYRSEEQFKLLASRVGLTEAWFIALAEIECEKWQKPQE
jgi:hypothetical protein